MTGAGSSLLPDTKQSRSITKLGERNATHTRPFFFFFYRRAFDFLLLSKNVAHENFWFQRQNETQKKKKKSEGSRPTVPRFGERCGCWTVRVCGKQCYLVRREESRTRDTPIRGSKVQRRAEEALPPPSGWRHFASALRRPSSGCRTEGTCPPLGAGAPPREPQGRGGKDCRKRERALQGRPVSVRFPAALLRPGVPSQSQVRRRYRLDARAPGMPELPHGLHRGSTAPTDGTLTSNQREGRKKARQRRKWTPVLPLSFPRD